MLQLSLPLTNIGCFDWMTLWLTVHKSVMDRLKICHWPTSLYITFLLGQLAICCRMLNTKTVWSIQPVTSSFWSSGGFFTLLIRISRKAEWIFQLRRQERLLSSRNRGAGLFTLVTYLVYCPVFTNEIHSSVCYALSTSWTRQCKGKWNGMIFLKYLHVNSQLTTADDVCMCTNLHLSASNKPLCPRQTEDEFVGLFMRCCFHLVVSFHLLPKSVLYLHLIIVKFQLGICAQNSVSQDSERMRIVSMCRIGYDLRCVTEISKTTVTGRKRVHVVFTNHGFIYKIGNTLTGVIDPVKSPRTNICISRPLACVGRHDALQDYITWLASKMTTSLFHWPLD